MRYLKQQNIVRICLNRPKCCLCKNLLLQRSRPGVAMHEQDRDAEAIRTFAYGLGLSLKKYCRIYQKYYYTQSFNPATARDQTVQKKCYYNTLFKANPVNLDRAVTN